MEVFHLVPLIFFTCFGLFSSVDAQESPEFYNYTITKTWNNQTSPENATISLSFSLERDPAGFRSLRINIQAPFFNDPVSPPNATDEPFWGLWEYEVVEAFFLGDNDEYLEIEVAPSSHYVLLYLNGYRNDTEMYLPLRHVTTKIDNSTTPPTWTGDAFIPANYFPCNVTKFNAYAIHKSDPNRRYMSLFPVAEETPNPDFHYLPAFQPAPFLSQIINPLCQTYQHNIKTTWDGKPSGDMAEIFISFFLQEGSPEKNRSVLMEINAPFFEDPAAPDADTQEPFPGLWNFEVVEAFFLGNDNEYLEVEFAPSGHYLLLYLAGYRNDTGRYLPMTNYISKVVNSTGDSTGLKRRWIGEAQIPAEYFPCNVSRMNAYAIHKSNSSRSYMSLFPVEEGELEEPDFHYLQGFGSFNFGEEVNLVCTSVPPTTTPSSSPSSVVRVFEQSFFIFMGMLFRILLMV